MTTRLKLSKIPSILYSSPNEELARTIILILSYNIFYTFFHFHTGMGYSCQLEEAELVANGNNFFSYNARKCPLVLCVELEASCRSRESVLL